MKASQSTRPIDAFRRPRIWPYGLIAVALIVLAVMPARALPSPLYRLRATLSNHGLNQSDLEHMERGYYETLLNKGRSLGDPLPAQSQRNASESQAGGDSFRHGHMVIPTGDFREYALKPNMRIQYWTDDSWTTNSRGLRDREYAIPKPRGTIRIALLGDSIGCGWGVGDDESFENLWELALNRQLSENRANGKTDAEVKVEVLNFAVPGLSPGQRWEHFQRSGWLYEPDMVVYEATLADLGWDERRLRVLLPQGYGWDVAAFAEVLKAAGARPGGSSDEYRDLLRPLRKELLGGTYHAIASECQKRNIPTVWMLIPRLGKTASVSERDQIQGLARDNGFGTVFDISQLFTPAEEAALVLSPNDYHPNAAGHRRIADAVIANMANHPDLRKRIEAVRRELTLPQTAAKPQNTPRETPKERKP